jgi:hypothetical protein
MNLGVFPSSYVSLINSSTDTKYYIDAVNGSNSNDGTSIATPWQTYAYAFDQTKNVTSAIMFIFAEGTYTQLIVDPTDTSFTSALIADNNKPRTFVCQPGKVIFTGTGSSVRDMPMYRLGPTSSVYGAIFRRDNNGKTANYSVAMVRGTGGYPGHSGNVYNCVFEEINANGNWSLQYDNWANSTGQIVNSLFNVVEVGASDYAGSSGLVLSNCAFTYTWGSGNATKTNTDVGVTVISSNTQIVDPYKITSNNTSKGVWSGTYKWEILSSIYFSNSTANNITTIPEGSSFNIILDTQGQNVYNSIPYTITGVSAGDLNISLSGARASNASGFVNIAVTANADYTSSEGTELMTVTMGNSSIVTNEPTNSAYILDTSSILHVTPGVDIQTGDTIKFILTTVGEPNGQAIPYTISGATSVQLNGANTSGNFIINNNTANLSIAVVGVINQNISMSAYGANLSVYVSFNRTLTSNTDMNISNAWFYSNNVVLSNASSHGVDAEIGGTASWFYSNNVVLSNASSHGVDALINGTESYYANVSWDPYIPDTGGGGTVAEKEYWS